MKPLEIEAFLAIVRLGNVTKAARFLFISQSTLSQRLQSLESELEVTLIQRNKGMGNTSLTPAGEKFLKVALKWEELMIEARDLKYDQTRSSLTIGAVDSIHSYVLSPLYQAMRKHYQNMKLVIRTHQSNEIYSLLEHKEIDIGFPLQERVLKHFKAEKFFEEEMVLIQKNSEKPSSDPIDNLELQPEYELYINWGTEFRIWHEKWWGIEGTYGIQIDTGTLISMFMTHSENWAIVPLSMAKALQKTEPIRICSILSPPPPRNCFLVYSEIIEEQIAGFQDCLSLTEETIMERVKKRL